MIKSKLKFSVVATMLGASFALPSFCFGAAAGGAMVMGAGTCVVTTVGGPIATAMSLAMTEESLAMNIETTEQSLSSDIDAAEQSINNQIKEVGDMLNDRIKNDDKSILDQLKRNGASQKESTKLLAQQIRDLLVEDSAAEEKMRAERMYGKLWRMDSACSDPEAAEGIQVGKKAERLVSTESYTLLKEHNEMGYSSSGPNSYIQAIRDVDSEEITAEVILPKDSVMGPDEVANAQLMGEMITNPSPTPNIPERLSERPEAQAYEVQKKVKEARLAVPQKVFSDNIAAHAATVPLEGWAADTYERMGGTGNPEGVQDGKMSPMSLLNMQVDMRYANPNWSPDVFASSEKQALYELLNMNAVRMEIERRQLMLLQQIALLLAQDQSARVNQEQDPLIRARYNQLLSKGAE
jgi:hypothetical protein